MRRDVGKVFVQLFDVTLEAYFGRHLLCIHAPTCGYGPALEHNGDLYTCDHFVEPGQKLGNIATTPLIDLVASPQMRKFGDDKRDTLTKQCRECEVRFLCNGGCPEGPLCAVEGRRAGPELPLRRARTLLHPHPPADGGDGAAPEARPPARRRDALGQERGLRSATLMRPVRAAAGASSSSATATRRRRRRWRDTASSAARSSDAGGRRSLIASTGARHRRGMTSASGRGAAGSSSTGNLAASTMSRSRKKLRNVRMKAIAAQTSDVVPARRAGRDDDVVGELERQARHQPARVAQVAVAEISARPRGREDRADAGDEHLDRADGDDQHRHRVDRDDRVVGEERNPILHEALRRDHVISRPCREPILRRANRGSQRPRDAPAARLGRAPSRLRERAWAAEADRRPSVAGAAVGLFQLSHDRVEVERRRLLARRELLELGDLAAPRSPASHR